MNYIKLLMETKEVKQTTDITEVAELLQTRRWIAIASIYMDNGIDFVLIRLC